MTDKCAYKVMERLGMDLGTVLGCMNASFYTMPRLPPSNVYLAEDAQRSLDLGVTFIPSLVINDVPYRGEMEGYAIFRAICRAFRFGHEPYVCDPGADI